MHLIECVVGKLDYHNISWDYPSLQINIPLLSQKLFPDLHQIFRIELEFKNNEVRDIKNNKFLNGIYHTRIVKDKKGIVENNTDRALCSIWDTKRTKDGVLIAWFKSHNIIHGDTITISIDGNNFFLNPK